MIIPCNYIFRIGEHNSKSVKNDLYENDLA